VHLHVLALSLVPVLALSLALVLPVLLVSERLLLSLQPALGAERALEQVQAAPPCTCTDSVPL
jgi:hypothetical protein